MTIHDEPMTEHTLDPAALESAAVERLTARCEELTEQAERAGRDIAIARNDLREFKARVIPTAVEHLNDAGITFCDSGLSGFADAMGLEMPDKAGTCRARFEIYVEEATELEWNGHEYAVSSAVIESFEDTLKNAFGGLVNVTTVYAEADS